MSFSRRLLRTLARGFIYPAVEITTLLLLMALRRLQLWEREMGILRPTGDDPVLVIAAHPDDETIGCMGAILLHLSAGDAVKVLMVTDGSGSRAGDSPQPKWPTPATTRSTNSEELMPCLVIEQLCFEENNWTEADLLTQVSTTFTEFRPQIIYAPSCVDFHPEHLKVARCLARALIQEATGDVKRIRAYEMQVPLGNELVNLYAPLTQKLQEKRASHPSLPVPGRCLEHVAQASTLHGSIMRFPRRCRSFLGDDTFSLREHNAVWDVGLANYSIQ